MCIYDLYIQEYVIVVLFIIIRLFTLAHQAHFSLWFAQDLEE